METTETGEARESGTEVKRGSVSGFEVSQMRSSARDILNCGGGGGGDDEVLLNPNRRTPDHPPYSEMVSVALRALAEENGSTESSISSYIRRSFNDLPWGHDRLLPYYLLKLVADGELTSSSPDRYQLLFHPLPSVSLPIRRRGRPRLHPENPNPSLSSLPSAPPRHRGSSQPFRRRGRPPKVHAQDTLPLHLEQGTPPLRRGIGRSRLRRGDSTGRKGTQRLGRRIPGSRGSNGRQESQDSFLVSNTEELNCQSCNLAFFNDINNGGSECGVLEDPEHIELGQAQLEQGQPFVVSEQYEIGKGQFLEEEQPLLILEPGTMPPFLASEHCEHVEGQSLQGEELPFVALEQTEFSQDQSLLGEKLPLLNPEQGKLLPFLSPQLYGRGQGQSMQGEAPPFMPPEQTEFVQVQFLPRERLPFFTPDTRKMPLFLAPELFERDQGQPLQGEEPPFMSADLIELVQKQSSEGPPLSYPAQSEHDHGLLLGAPEECEDSHDQRFPLVGTADPKEGELALIPRPTEVEDATVYSKKRKSHGRRRSLRLWFES